MNANEFKEQLKKGATGGYLFYGDESYMKQHSLFELRKKLGISEEDRIKLSGDGKTGYQLADGLAEELSCPSMLGGNKLVELHEVNFNKLTDKEIEAISQSVTSSLDDSGETVLVFCTEPDELDPGRGRTQSKTLKALSAFLKPVVFEKISPERLAGWAAKHFAAEGLEADIGCCSELVAYCSCDMLILKSEIEKLCAFLVSDGRKRLTREDIYRVSSHNSDIDAFDFVNAILSGDSAKAYFLMDDMKRRREEPNLILAGISQVCCDLCVIKSLTARGMIKQEIARQMKMHEYPVGLRMQAAERKSAEVLMNAVEKCFDADIKIKSTPLDKYTVIERLIADIAGRTR